MFRFRFLHALLGVWLAVGCSVSPAMASAPQATHPSRQSVDDAWFTGPMLANSAATLPQGHWLIEPYLYGVVSSHAVGYGSLTYMLYGLTDRLTVGLVPVFGYNIVDGGPNSSSIGIGDISVLTQYRLVSFPAESSLPTVSLQLEETLPTGRYDRLGNRPSDGLGSGARVTTLALNTQTWFWMANGRILRMRFNVSRSFASHADVKGVSVYGTSQDFRGLARPGDVFAIDNAWEYSITRHWVLALDLTYSRSADTRARGYDMLDGGTVRPFQLASGTSEAFGFAPAIEYNWNAHLGLLIGVRVITGPHMSTTVTPAVALDIVH